MLDHRAAVVVLVVVVVVWVVVWVVVCVVVVPLDNKLVIFAFYWRTRFFTTTPPHHHTTTTTKPRPRSCNEGVHVPAV
jgi:hypothetical protein